MAMVDIKIILVKEIRVSVNALKESWFIYKKINPNLFHWYSVVYH